jgi:phosphatidylglycerophosphate synthase
VPEGVRRQGGAQQRLRGVSATTHVVLLVPRDLAPAGEPGEPPPAALTAAVDAATARARQAGAGGPCTVVQAGSTSGALVELADAAERAAHDGEALAVLDVDLAISPVALLDLFDHAGRRTAALVRDGAPGEDGAATLRDGWTPVRDGAGRKALVESVGTPDHAVRAPNAVALGALRVDAADVPAAARLWRQAASREWAGSPSAMALIALTRGGVAVSAVPLQQFTARRQLTEAAEPALDQDPWRLRLLSAARPVDGFYSIFVVRKVSRALTWRLLPTGVSPNTVTVVSLLVGLLTAVLCGIGGWPLLVVAAVLLQVSLVLDCVDGEIARYTRRFSPLGAWLDVSGDRLKENGVYAGLALWSFRSGNDLWVWAVLAMALIAYRHFVDYGFGVSQRVSLLPRVFTGPLDQPDDGEGRLAPGQSTRLSTFVSASDATSATAWVHWLKKAVHLPIGERYLVISLALLTGRPLVVFAILVVLEVLAVVYTTGGRVLRSLSGSAAGSPSAGTALSVPDLARPTWGEIDHQLDIGPLARIQEESLPVLWRTPVAAVVSVGLTLVVAVAVALGLHPIWLLPAAAALPVGLALGAVAPVVGRLAWAAPSTLFAVEAAVVLMLQHRLAPAAGGAAFVFVAAAAYRRYDIIYRTRDLGRPPAAWTDRVTFGVDGRLLLVALAALFPGSFAGVLLVAGAVVGGVVLLESTAAWVRWLRAPHRSGDIVAPAAAPGSVADVPAEPGDELTSP